MDAAAHFSSHIFVLVPILYSSSFFFFVKDSLQTNGMYPPRYSWLCLFCCVKSVINSSHRLPSAHIASILLTPLLVRRAAEVKREEKKKIIINKSQAFRLNANQRMLNFYRRRLFFPVLALRAAAHLICFPQFHEKERKKERKWGYRCGAPAKQTSLNNTFSVQLTCCRASHPASIRIHEEGEILPLSGPECKRGGSF